MLEGLRGYFLNRDEPYRSMHGDVEQCVRVESVELDASVKEHEVVILARDLKRPECAFGWRSPCVEPGVFENALYIFETVKEAAEMHARITCLGFEGSVVAIGHGLPKECTPGAIN